MRPRARWAVVLIALTIAACADADFAVDGARAHRRVVFQVEAGPRIPGTPGHQTVRLWIASELARLGGQVRLQSFIDSTPRAPGALTHPIWRRGAETRAPPAPL